MDIFFKNILEFGGLVSDDIHKKTITNISTFPTPLTTTATASASSATGTTGRGKGRGTGPGKINTQGNQHKQQQQTSDDDTRSTTSHSHTSEDFMQATELSWLEKYWQQRGYGRSFPWHERQRTHPRLKREESVNKDEFTILFQSTHGLGIRWYLSESGRVLVSDLIADMAGHACQQIVRGDELIRVNERELREMDDLRLLQLIQSLDYLVKTGEVYLTFRYTNSDDSSIQEMLQADRLEEQRLSSEMRYITGRQKMKWNLVEKIRKEIKKDHPYPSMARVSCMGEKNNNHNNNHNTTTTSSSSARGEAGIPDDDYELWEWELRGLEADLDASLPLRLFDQHSSYFFTQTSPLIRPPVCLELLSHYHDNDGSSGSSRETMSLNETIIQKSLHTIYEAIQHNALPLINHLDNENMSPPPLKTTSSQPFMIDSNPASQPINAIRRAMVLSNRDYLRVYRSHAIPLGHDRIKALLNLSWPEIVSTISLMMNDLRIERSVNSSTPPSTTYHRSGNIPSSGSGSSTSIASYWSQSPSVEKDNRMDFYFPLIRSLSLTPTAAAATSTLSQPSPAGHGEVDGSGSNSGGGGDNASTSGGGSGEGDYVCDISARMSLDGKLKLSLPPYDITYSLLYAILEYPDMLFLDHEVERLLDDWMTLFDCSSFTKVYQVLLEHDKWDGYSWKIYFNNDLTTETDCRAYLSIIQDLATYWLICKCQGRCWMALLRNNHYQWRLGDHLIDYSTSPHRAIVPILEEPSRKIVNEWLEIALFLSNREQPHAYLACVHSIITRLDQYEVDLYDAMMITLHFSFLSGFFHLLRRYLVSKKGQLDCLEWTKLFPLLQRCCQGITTKLLGDEEEIALEEFTQYLGIVRGCCDHLCILLSSSCSSSSSSSTTSSLTQQPLLLSTTCSIRSDELLQMLLILPIRNALLVCKEEIVIQLLARRIAAVMMHVLGSRAYFVLHELPQLTTSLDPAFFLLS
eukprot:gene5916-6513_t